MGGGKISDSATGCGCGCGGSGAIDGCALGTVDVVAGAAVAVDAVGMLVEVPELPLAGNAGALDDADPLALESVVLDGDPVAGVVVDGVDC